MRSVTHSVRSLQRICHAACLRVPQVLTIALVLLTPARADELPEYRLKAAFLFNFAAFTDWPAETGPTLNLCLFGGDPFGAELDALQGKKVGERTINLSRRVNLEGLKSCQVVFVAAAAQDSLPRVLEALRTQPTLTVADSPGALQRGVGLNMHLSQGRVSFEANVKAVKAVRLGFSSRLLRLATEVLQ